MALLATSLPARTPSAPAMAVDVPPAASASTAVRTTDVLPELPPPTLAGGRLRVAALGVDAPIVRLGLSPDLTMEAPDAPGDTGWYAFSALPGEPGLVVVAGHLDRRGEPGAFARLAEARAGDIVAIDYAGRTYAYAVRSLRAVPVDDRAALAAIAGAGSGDALVLITCTGPFDAVRGRYSERLLVVATPLDAPPASALRVE